MMTFSGWTSTRSCRTVARRRRTARASSGLKSRSRGFTENRRDQTFSVCSVKNEKEEKISNQLLSNIVFIPK